MNEIPRVLQIKHKMTLLSEVFNEEYVKRYLHILLSKNDGNYSMFCQGGVRIDFFPERYCLYYNHIIIEQSYGRSITPVNITTIIDEILEHFRMIERCSDCDCFSHIVDQIDRTCGECLLNKCLRKPDDDCSICLSPLSKLRCVTIRTCGHHLHYQCERKLRGSSEQVRCPLCRTTYCLYDLRS